MRAAELEGASLGRRAETLALSEGNQNRSSHAGQVHRRSHGPPSEGRSHHRALCARHACAAAFAVGQTLQPNCTRGRACGRRSVRRQRPLAERCAGLGSHPRLSRISLGPRARRRRGDGHRAARHGPRLAAGARADQALDRACAHKTRRRDLLRRRHRPSRPGRSALDRRCDQGLRDAVRGHRSRRRAHHPDGFARAFPYRQRSGRLCEGLRPHPDAGARARDHPLARRHVRSGLGRLLGHARS